MTRIEKIATQVLAGKVEGPAIWVGDLKAYNEGRLTGEWLELSDFADQRELGDYIESHILEPGNEEWEIMDSQNLNFKVGPYMDLKTLWNKYQQQVRSE